ncbi:MAG: glutathione S-transferase N-terminal domain-containing protein, partial [Solirubrobacterales bacterium]
MATLYRCRLPGDRLCACGKVSRELRRQDVEFEEVRVAWLRRDREEVEGLSGQRVVPLLVTDEATICDSRRIVEHLRRRAASEEPVVGERGQAVVEEVAPKELVLEELVLE